MERSLGLMEVPVCEGEREMFLGFESSGNDFRGVAFLTDGMNRTVVVIVTNQ